MLRKLILAAIGLALLGALAFGGLLLYDELVTIDEASEEISAPTLEADTSGEQVVFRIDKTQSQVSFHLQEDLSGVRTNVIGVTNEVAGDVLVDFAQPEQSVVGQIRINARTLETDRSARNNRIRSSILNTNTYEFIEFTPTQLLNFPANPQIGQQLSFQIVGDLLIREISQRVTFDATVTLVDDNRLEGTASTVITRDQFDLEIPRVPGVANVTNEVDLRIDFVALRVDSSANVTDNGAAISDTQG
jgi:polyisoprenoid-binding protein YceI